MNRSPQDQKAQKPSENLEPYFNAEPKTKAAKPQPPLTPLDLMYAYYDAA